MFRLTLPPTIQASRHLETYQAKCYHLVYVAVASVLQHNLPGNVG